MNAIIMKDTHLHEDEHVLKVHERLHKARLAKLFLAHSFINYFVEY